MDFHPLNGFVVAVAVANRLQVTRIVEEYGMAIHAGFRRRDAGKGGRLHACMAVAAIDSVVPYVMFVAELDGLSACNVLPRHVRRARRGQNRQDSKPHQKKKRKDT